LAYGVGGRAPVFTKIYRLNAFILDYFGRNRDTVAKTFQLSPTHWIKVRYSTYKDLSIETGINTAPIDSAPMRLKTKGILDYFDWNRFRKLMKYTGK
jgi:hypothetical protein